jgi:membrane dipeptidase
MPVRAATSVAEIRAAKAAGEVAVVMHLQGCEPLRPGAELVEVFARLGVRVIQPTYNYRGPAGDGCCEPGNAGLSQFGNTLISAMNRQASQPRSPTWRRPGYDVARSSAG